jgi:type IV secretory pathway VirB6-like protein
MESPLWLLAPFVVALAPLFCPPRLVVYVSLATLSAEIAFFLFATSNMSEQAEGPEVFSIALYFYFVGIVYVFCVSVRVVDEIVTRAMLWFERKRRHRLQD